MNACQRCGGSAIDPVHSHTEEPHIGPCSECQYPEADQRTRSAALMAAAIAMSNLKVIDIDGTLRLARLLEQYIRSGCDPVRNTT